MPTAKKKTTKAAKSPAKAPFRIGFLVHDVSRMRRTVFDQAMKPLGVTRSQWWALANLSRQGNEGMTQTDLARVMDIGKVSLGRLIDRLEASGHVERRPAAVDRRVNVIFVTTRGQKVLADMLAVGAVINTKVLRAIDPAAVRAAEEVLHQMKENLRDTLNVTPLSDYEE